MRTPLRPPECGARVEPPFARMTHVSDLVYYDGPLLSHFVSKDGRHFLVHWLDCDDTRNRWLVSEVSADQIDAVLTDKVTLREALTAAPEVEVVDIGGGNTEAWRLKTAEFLLIEYLADGLPVPGTFLSKDDEEEEPLDNP